MSTAWAAQEGGHLLREHKVEPPGMMIGGTLWGSSGAAQKTIQQSCGAMMQQVMAACMYVGLVDCSVTAKALVGSSQKLAVQTASTMQSALSEPRGHHGLLP